MVYFEATEQAEEFGIMHAIGMVRTFTTDGEGRVRSTASARRRGSTQASSSDLGLLETPHQEADEPCFNDVQDIRVNDAEVDGYPGGPIDTTVFKTYGDHVAGRLWNGVDREELRIYNNGKKMKEATIHHDEAWVYEHFPTLCTDYCRLQPDYNELQPRSNKWKPKRDKANHVNRDWSNTEIFKRKKKKKKKKKKNRGVTQTK
ncbi:hypothetical protein TSUD_155050 [Trifolium subterraneum]|uniref:Uncharacterized protein n=1 Tax=Trifolium subterraneum TaxID=3900 RepID=A0A2Z6LZ95_TRISU|nr:hypothetical protein TSUD_155050 [Trifolium subterraneum]